MPCEPSHKFPPSSLHQSYWHSIIISHPRPNIQDNTKNMQWPIYDINYPSLLTPLEIQTHSIILDSYSRTFHFIITILSSWTSLVSFHMIMDSYVILLYPLVLLNIYVFKPWSDTLIYSTLRSILKSSLACIQVNSLSKPPGNFPWIFSSYKIFIGLILLVLLAILICNTKNSLVKSSLKSQMTSKAMPNSLGVPPDLDYIPQGYFVCQYVLFPATTPGKIILGICIHHHLWVWGTVMNTVHS